MPYTQLGQFKDEGLGARRPRIITADQIVGGLIFGEEIVVGGGTTGIIRSENYVPGVSGWAIFGDGSAEFNTVTVRGDIVSSNWDGADPANLSSVDLTSLAGFYLDSSVGAGQFTDTLFVGNALRLFEPGVSLIGSLGGTDAGGVALNAGTGAHPLKLLGGTTSGNVEIAPGTTGVAIIRTGATERARVTTQGIGVQAGSASDPSLYNSGDVDTGIYFTADNVRISAGGGLVAAFATDYLRTGDQGTGQAAVRLGAAGIVSGPAFTWSGASSSGFYWDTTNTAIGYAVGGVEKFYTSGSKAMVVLGGTGNTGNGIVINARDNNDQSVELLNDTGDRFLVFFNATTQFLVTTATLQYQGNTIWHAGNDGSGSGLDADLLDGIGSSGFATSGHNHNGTYAFSGGSEAGSANARYATGDQTVKVATSTIKGKDSVSPYLGLTYPDVVPIRKRTFRRTQGSVLDLTPVTFRSLHASDDPEQVFLGFIAEEAAQKFPLAYEHHETLPGINWNAVVAALLAEVKTLRRRVLALESQ